MTKKMESQLKHSIFEFLFLRSELDGITERLLQHFYKLFN